MTTTIEGRVTAFRKVVRPGTVPTYVGRRTSVFCKIELTEDGRLSISGVEGPTASGDCIGGAGQIGMHYAHRNPANDDRRSSSLTRPEDFTFAPGWDAERWLDFLDVWKRWHLNDMSPACEHQRALGWVEAAREEVTLYHWRLSRDLRDTVAAAKVAATAQLMAGETVTLPPAVLAVAALPLNVTTGSDVPPSSDYAANGPAYEGDMYNRPSEVKTRGWVRPDEHPGGLLTAPCPGCGYAYGSEWRREEVPAGVVDFLLGLPDADRAPAWV